ncbi:MAG: PKD domain-containing protein [Salinivirgaceae bacterium]|nr:PKD domain-containing protein [Salinivirgaceae bacterium]
MIKKLTYIFILLSLFSVNNTYSQVVASFTTLDSVGCNTLITDFVNSSQGSNLEYSWDFGNETFSELENPKAVYLNTGSYTVKLIVSNNVSSDTLIKANFINVYKSPNVELFTESPKIGCAPLEVDFQSEITQGDAGIMTAIWDFGDGSSSSEINPTHNFYGVNTYTISVYIQDSNFCESNYSISNYITTTPKPNLGFSASKTLSCFDTLTVNYTNSSSGVTDLNYLWDFGDGLESSLENPTHFYNGFSNYNVSLFVSDGYGCQDSLVKSNFIKLQELHAEILIEDDYLCKNETLIISNTTTGASSYQWLFGDGTTSNQMNPQKTYSDTGNFEITYVAALQTECFDTIKASVFVDRVTAKFETDINYICELPTQINYTSQAEYNNSWEWHIGFDYITDHANPSITIYENAEILKKRNLYLKDTLIVYSDMGCSDTLVVDSSIYVSIPKVYFTPNDTAIYNSQMSGCIPINVDFENHSISTNSSDPFVSWSWDFGDSEISDEYEESHTYNDIGEYEIKLVGENQSGCRNEFNAELIAGNPQNAMFEYTGIDSICGSNEIALTDLSTDSELVNAWVWQFSDGSSSTAQNPNVQFSDTGYIDVSLTVFHNNCMGSTFEMDSVVFVKGPAGNLVSTFTCADPYKYTFTSDIDGVEEWIWDFGDNSYDSTSTKIVEHIYDTTGNYFVRLIAINDNTNCGLEKTKTILARKLKADFEFGPLYNCIYDSISFDPNNSFDEYVFSSGGHVGKYLWNFKDTSAIIFSNGIIKHIYTQPGDFEVELKVKDINGCMDTITKNVHIYDVSPDFSITDSSGCSPFTVEFSDNSTADTTLSEWIWNFGDGGFSSTEQNPIHLFDAHNYYDVSLTVKDIFGCFKTLQKQSLIYTSKPVPNFSSVKPYHCFNDSIFFENSSFSQGETTYLWDFGDGNISNEFAADHLYTDTGFYSISLYIVDSLGCDSIIEKANYVYVQVNPRAGFSANSQSSICYPKIIGFNDTTVSDDLVNWIWDFGDGSVIQNIQMPFHTYQAPGLFDVKLIAITSLGCSDTIQKEEYIQINGPYAEISAPDSFCINIPTIISMQNNTGIDYFEWTTDDGESYYTESFNKTYLAPGKKQLFLTIRSDSIESCEKFYSDSIIIPELIANFDISDTAVCVPFNISFNQNSIGYNSIKWLNNDVDWQSDSEFDFNFINSGTYEIKLLIENTVGCKDSAIKNVQIYPLPVIKISNDTLLCQYDTVSIYAAGGNKYYWQVNNELIDSLSEISIYPLVSANYKVQVVDTNFCVSYDSVYVSVQPKPTQQLNASDSIRLIIGEQFAFEATIENADDFYWSPENIFDCSVCENSTIFPMKSVYIYLTSIDNNNCFKIIDSVFVQVDEKYSVDVPTAFSPNNDGVNDFIEVKGWGIKQVLELKIFNTSGQKVFESHEQNPIWDGYSFDGKSPSGMYIYQVKILSYDNTEKVKQGYFYLLD